MSAAIAHLKDAKLDKLAAEITDLITDAEETRIASAKKDKSLPWTVGALLAEAREEFPVGANEAYSNWIATGIIPEIPVAKTPDTFTNWKNLSINFAHLQPEIEDFKVTALYKLNAWAKENNTKDHRVSLDEVKSKLNSLAPKETPGQGKPKHVAIGTAAIKEEYGVTLTVKQARTIADKHVKPSLTFEINQYRTLDDYREAGELEALKLAYLDGYAAEHPEEVEAVAEQARAEFLENSRGRDPVKSLKEAEARIRRDLQQKAEEQIAEILADHKAKLEEETVAKYRSTWDRVKKDQEIVEKQLGAINKMKQGLKAFMTVAEFKLIVGVLHDDKYPGIDAEQKRRINKAFSIMQRLKDTLG